MGLPLGPLLVFKELADFIQIGLVAWQTGVRFEQQRSGVNGSLGISGGTVRVQMGDVSFTLPIEDAAAVAGVAGAAGRGKAPEKSALEKGGEVLGALLFPGPTVGGFLGDQVARLMGKPPEGGADAVVVAPSRDQRPFTLREWVTLQTEAVRKGGDRKDRRERELAALEQQHKERLAGLDAQIAREKIAGLRDVSRLEVAGRLELQREELVAKFGLQERELVAKHALGAQEQAAEMARLQAKLEADRALQRAEEEWKTSERVADQKWKAEQARIAEDWGYYWKNAAADRAVSRSLEAAKGIVDILERANASQAAVVGFASVFGRGVS